MATKITSGSIFSAGAIVTGVDASAPPATPSAPTPPVTVGWSYAGLSESERVAPAANGMQLYSNSEPYTNEWSNRTFHDLPEYLEGLPVSVERTETNPQYSLANYTFNTSGTLYLVHRGGWVSPITDNLQPDIMDWNLVEENVGYMGGAGPYGTKIYSKSISAGTYQLNNIFFYAFKADPAPPPSVPEPAPEPAPSPYSQAAEGTWTVATVAQFGDNFNGQAFIMREGGNNTPLSTPATGNMVGSSVAISDDYVFVGNSYYDEYGMDAGAVFVFDKATGDMVRTLTGPGITAGSGYGSPDMTVVNGGVNRVALRSFSRAQIVGSPNESYGYGHIQIMDFDGGNVVEISHPDFDINQGYDNAMGFGVSTGWTPTKFVAAMNGSYANGAESGSVFIFNHDGTLTTRLDGQNAGDKFGRDISTQSNHERVLVGVSGWNNKAGKVQLFESDGTEVFSIERPTTEAGAHGSAQPEFGMIVAYGSGRIAVGENLDTSVGRVHIFDEIDGSYINTVSLPRNDNPATSDLEIVGNYIFVSASGVNSNNGAFWVYDLDGNNGTRIDNIGTSGFARFGHHVAASVG